MKIKPLKDMKIQANMSILQGRGRFCTVTKDRNHKERPTANTCNTDTEKKPAVAAHPGILATWEAQWEDYRFKVSLGKSVRPHLKTKLKRLGMLLSGPKHLPSMHRAPGSSISTANKNLKMRIGHEPAIHKRSYPNTGKNDKLNSFQKKLGKNYRYHFSPLNQQRFLKMTCSVAKPAGNETVMW